MDSKDFEIVLVKVFRIVLSTARCLPRKMVSYKWSSSSHQHYKLLLFMLAQK